ncbi:MAG: YhcH/YjgK/YiaL family protein [Clostridia bacterium]|nr:YhcH/YjgK/YiaL family protein [Clostridia bacterium]
MVFDNIKNCELYYGMHPRFREGFDFIKKAIAENLPDGKYEIDGKELWASVQEYTSKLESEAKAEAHKNYIDIQYIVSGVEVIEGFDIDKATEKSEYNDVKDVMFYENYALSTKGILSADEYGIFFPRDVHKPGMCLCGNQATVKKIVVKVKV